MPKYTIRLDQLQCNFIRDKEYDDLSVAAFLVEIDGNVIVPENAPADGSIANPITGVLASVVHTGDTISFGDSTPDNAAAWELSFDDDGSLPPWTPVDITVTISNTHGLTDPAALREIIKIALAGAGGAIGGAPGDATQKLATVILGAIGAAAGTAAGDELSSLFAGAPRQCQGTVFNHIINKTIGGLRTQGYQPATPPGAAPGVAVEVWSDNNVPSDAITDTKPECGHPPDYTLAYSILREGAQIVAPFGGPGVGTRSFVPLLNRALDQWVGDWVFQFVASEIPRTTCKIILSTNRAALHVQLVEHFGTWNGVELVSFDIDGLVPQAYDRILYAGDELPGARKPYAHPVLAQLSSIATMKEQIGQKASTRLLETHGASNRTLRKAMQAIPSENLAANSATLLDLPPAKPALSGFLSNAVQGLMPLFIDKADTIWIPAKNVVLSLYAYLQNNKEIGRVVRYTREANFLYTMTDAMLFPPVEIH